MGIVLPVVVTTAEAEVVVKALVGVDVVVACVEVDAEVIEAFVEVDVAEVVVLIATLYPETERTASEPMRRGVSNLMLN